MKKCRFIRLCALLSACLLCSGCGLDVEQFLRPPATGGEQQAVQQALETYLGDRGLSDKRYTLCYPVEGEHQAAFILCDEAGRPLAEGFESASQAVAFYRLPSAPQETHINLLRRDEQGWVSVADTVGAAAEVLQVAFGDLDGDGAAELITGWDTYNSRDHRLVLFSMASGLLRLSDDRVYSRLYVGNLTADGRDDLVLLGISSGGEVSATLETLSGNKLTRRGQVWLDSGIQQFTGMTLCRLADGANGLYIDAVKGTDTAVTELLYMDDTGLQAPFCHQASRINTATARPAGFAMRDIDGDAQVEIPQCTLLDGYTATDKTPDYAYRTDWLSWDYATQEFRTQVSTVVNAADGYFISLDEEQWGTLTTTYMQDEHLLTLQSVEDNRPLLRLRPVGDGTDDTYTVLFQATDGYVGCEVWFDETRLDIDAVRYMVARWEV